VRTQPCVVPGVSAVGEHNGHGGGIVVRKLHASDVDVIFMMRSGEQETCFLSARAGIEYTHRPVHHGQRSRHRAGNLPATSIPSTLIPAATHTVEA
jgi:hypothetical protein